MSTATCVGVGASRYSGARLLKSAGCAQELMLERRRKSAGSGWVRRESGIGRDSR